jgi:hypothetical protein
MLAHEPTEGDGSTNELKHQSCSINMSTELAEDDEPPVQDVFSWQVSISWRTDLDILLSLLEDEDERACVRAHIVKNMPGMVDCSLRKVLFHEQVSSPYPGFDELCYAVRKWYALEIYPSSATVAHETVYRILMSHQKDIVDRIIQLTAINY